MARPMPTVATTNATAAARNRDGRRCGRAVPGRRRSASGHRFGASSQSSALNSSLKSVIPLLQDPAKALSSLTEVNTDRSRARPEDPSDLLGRIADVVVEYQRGPLVRREASEPGE